MDRPPVGHQLDPAPSVEQRSLFDLPSHHNTFDLRSPKEANGSADFRQRRVFESVAEISEFLGNQPFNTNAVD